MDTRVLFQNISKKLSVDFEAASQINHRGSRGTVRENILKDFLAEGRLPAKYGIGSGEIVGRVRDVSKQSDIIIYDKLNGVTLLYDETTKVFPIDSVYGIIEVKSALSKSEFIDCLNKIKVFKSMSINGSITQQIGGGLTITHARSRPFGMIFAFSLAGNSLSSLFENLREWESENPSAVWPNYICILGSGVIYHNKSVFDSCIPSSKIDEKSYPLYLEHGDDSLFQFYCALHDACAEMQLGTVELTKYYDPAVRIGDYVIYGRGVEGSVVRNGRLIRSHITEKAIEHIVSWCSAHGAIKYGETLIKRFGCIPMGMEDSQMLSWDVYLYNPNDLAGITITELEKNPITNHDGRIGFSQPCLASAMELVINDVLYVIPYDSLSSEDFVDCCE